jgi:N-sulfoglucosamine sulfohydrolase
MACFLPPTFMGTTIGRRDFLQRCGVMAAVADTVPHALAAPAGPSPAAGAQRPNILYLHSHDTGRYIQPYGYAVPAPHLQQLATGGVLFRQAFSAAPTCSPSRAALLTGQAPHSCGMLGLVNHGFSLAQHSHHLAHTLKQAGYETAVAGVQHILQQEELAGYDHNLKVGNMARTVAPAAVKFLRAPRRQPFFFAVGFFETHRPFPSPGPQEDPRFTLPPAPIADTPATRADMAAYHASVRVLDNAIGSILAALEQAGLADNTLVIYSTDHGISFPEMKVDLRDAGIGVSLIMRGPREFSGGKVVDALVSQLDVFPTLCDYTGVARPAWLEGTSMLPLLRGETPAIRDEVFAEVNYHAAYEPKRGVRTERWKYIRNYGDYGKAVLSNVDDSPSKRLWVDHGWREHAVPREQLYDLLFDPHEAHNLAGNESLRPTLEEMRARLDRWMTATHDPLLQGRVPAPSGARLNRPDQLSFTEPRDTIP